MVPADVVSSVILSQRYRYRAESSAIGASNCCRSALSSDAAVVGRPQKNAGIAFSASGVPRRTFDGLVGYGPGDGIPTVSWLEIGLGDKAIIGEDMPGW